MHRNKPLKERSDIEIMSIMHDMQSKMFELQKALEAVEQEAKRRINDFKKSEENATDSNN